jgi:Thioredoxin
MGTAVDYAKVGLDQILKWEREPGISPPLAQVRRPNSLKGKTVDKKVPGSPGEFSPAMGTLDAPVEVVVFSDFQCPNCQRIVEPLKLLVRKHHRDVLVTWKHLALDSHKKAFDASVASCVAGRLDKFWEFQELCFQNMRNLDPSDLRKVSFALSLLVACLCVCAFVWLLFVSFFPPSRMHR